MEDTLHVTDRIVVVTAGFGVWRDNRHMASGLWADVVEVRALAVEQATAGTVRIVLTLRDGAEVSIDDGLSGYQPFLDAAEAKLPGMTLPGMTFGAAWFAASANPEAKQGTVLFRRDARV